MGQIHCEITGRGKKNLILVHGFCANHKIWSPFKASICQEWRVITPDLPGFGRSQMVGPPFTIQNVAAQLNDWVQSRGFDKPVLIGHSLGGYICLDMIARQPDNYGGIGLFHSTAMPDTDEKKTSRNKVLEFVKAHGVQRFVDSFIPGLYYNRKHPSLAKAHRIASKTSQKAFFYYTIAMRDRPSAVEVLAQAKVPILILAGQYDPVISLESLQKQAELSKKITFKILTDTGHMGMFEAREEACEAINNFIKKAVERQ